MTGIIDEIDDAIVDFVWNNQPVSGNAVAFIMKDAPGCHSPVTVRKRLNDLAERGYVECERGPRNAQLWQVTPKWLRDYVEFPPRAEEPEVAPDVHNQPDVHDGADAAPAHLPRDVVLAWGTVSAALAEHDELTERVRVLEAENLVLRARLESVRTAIEEDATA